MVKEIQVEDIKNSAGTWIKSYRENGVRYHTKSAVLWNGMKSRCTSGSAAQKRMPNYVNCTYSESFSDFQFFTDWCNSQIGYGSVGYDLEKDFLSAGKKVYSDATCVFVPTSLNSFLVRGGDHSEKSCPQGVFALRDKFRSIVNISGKPTHLGCFPTIDEAANAYATAKTAEAHRWHSRLVAGEFIVDPRIIELLRTWTFKHGD